MNRLAILAALLGALMATSFRNDSAEVLGPSAADEIGTPGVIDLVAELRHADIDVATSRIRMGSTESHEHVRGDGATWCL